MYKRHAATFQTLMRLGHVTDLFYHPSMDQASDTVNGGKSHLISETKLTTDPAPWAATCLRFPEKMFDTLWKALRPCREVSFLQYPEVTA